MTQVKIPAGNAELEGVLELPRAPRAVVAFSHGSGSGRKSPRNRFVAAELRRAGVGTLLLDLLTVEEDRDYEMRFDIDLLADRLVDATDWLGQAEETRGLPIGYFGASTGGGAALVAAARRPNSVRAVVSRGGRPDLAGAALSRVHAPTLLIVGGADHVVLELNGQALERLRCEKKLEIVAGATHLFEEPGALEEVARLARDWFLQHLAPQGAAPRPLRPRDSALLP